jgi:hypothetical protein
MKGKEPSARGVCNEALSTIELCFVLNRHPYYRNSMREGAMDASRISLRVVPDLG